MSEIRVNKLIDEAGTGAVELTQGATIPSAKTISGAGAISVTGNVASSGQISGATGSFTGNVSVGGTLTYDDVTNVDSIGLVTSRSGLRVVGGGATITGVTTFFNDIRVKGVIENVSAATTFLDANSKVVLELDLLGSTTYSYAMQPASIGIAAEAISNGATGKITVVGGINSGQTGLTTAQKYFVQPTGTLATSAGSPSVVAGTAISDTKIVVQKS